MEFLFFSERGRMHGSSYKKKNNSKKKKSLKFCTILLMQFYCLFLIPYQINSESHGGVRAKKNLRT